MMEASSLDGVLSSEKLPRLEAGTFLKGMVAACSNYEWEPGINPQAKEPSGRHQSEAAPAEIGRKDGGIAPSALV